jgi:hypothetical protein
VRADGAVGVVKGEAAIQGMPGRPSDWLTVGKVCAIWERYSGGPWPGRAAARAAVSRTVHRRKSSTFPHHIE